MKEAEPIDKRAESTLELSPGVRQETVLSLELRESLRILQMDHQALVDEIHREAEVNPVVEVGGGDTPVVSDELRTESQNDDAQFESSPIDDEPSLASGPDEAAAERRQRFFDRQVASESLQEHLLAQLGSSELTGSERELAELLIGDVDDDGRYVGSLDDLQEVTGASQEALIGVLQKVQTFDPPGVAARDLRECLGIQARMIDLEPKTRELLLAIIDAHLKTLARRGVAEVAKTLGVSVAECEAALKVMRTLEPKPGRQFVPNGRHPIYIVPELEVERTPQGLVLSMCTDDVPTLKVSETYREMLLDEDTSKETRSYLKERIGSAERLQEAIRWRGETIFRVAETIFSEQRDFFDKGFEALHPLTIEKIANLTGYHGTTVGRAVRGKYVRTPRGVHELRSFFCVGRLNDGSENPVSAIAVKCRLQGLIESENGASMTDDELAKALSKDGIRISRRTIAKYRSELGIATASKRAKGRMT